MTLRDPVSSASHLLTAAWAVYATLVLVRLTPPRSAKRRAVAVFGLSMVLLYAASGTFHAVPGPPDDRTYRYFQLLDHTAILLLIAGTNTPLMLVLLGGRRGRICLAAMWMLAATGAVCLWLLPRPPYALLIALYVGMGWVGVLPFPVYHRRVGGRAMAWAYAGVLVYSIGAACEFAAWPRPTADPVRIGHHEVLHLCDTIASVAFFGFMLRAVVPFPDR